MERERPWRVAIRIAAWVVGGLLVVLVVTGILLTVHSRSAGSGAYANVADLEHHSFFSARSVHRVAALLFIPAAGGLIVASIGLGLTRWNRRSIVLPAIAGALTLAAVFTGDPLSRHGRLWAVTVGTNMQTGTPLLHHNGVSYILIGSTASGPGSYGAWFWIHAALLPVFVALVLGAVLLAVPPRISD